MAQNISTYLYPAFTLAAGATANLEIRMTDISDMKVLLQQTWAQTSGTTGLAINLFAGFGANDPAENPKFPIPTILTNPASAPTYRISTIPV